MLCAFQTSFWPNLISFLPSPQLWLISIIYIATLDKPYTNIFFIYFLGYLLTHFIDAPLKLIWISLLIVYTSVWLTKKQIQISGTFSFVILTLIGSFLFEFSYYVFSVFLEDIPTQLNILDRLSQILINFIFCYPVFYVFLWLDNLPFYQNQWTKVSSSDSQGGTD